jgi:protein-S-isoprenylcysteine O-methyltransferase Ste14
MKTLIIFCILSVPVIILSWRTLFQVKSHGFYRFFSWECIVFLAANNYKHWFDNPFGIKQIFAWIFLIISSYLIIAAAILIKKVGKPSTQRDENALYQFEQTSELIDTGIYKYIRHPLYSSLLFLTWGIFFKNVNTISFIVSLLSSIFLYFTAFFDEKECTQFFGNKYVDYMKRSKRFIPFIF